MALVEGVVARFLAASHAPDPSESRGRIRRAHGVTIHRSLATASRCRREPEVDEFARVVGAGTAVRGTRARPSQRNYAEGCGVPSGWVRSPRLSAATPRRHGGCGGGSVIPRWFPRTRTGRLRKLGMPRGRWRTRNSMRSSPSCASTGLPEPSPSSTGLHSVPERDAPASAPHLTTAAAPGLSFATPHSLPVRPPPHMPV